MGVTADFNVIITESPVKSISISDIYTTEFMNGWWNEHTQIVDGEEITEKYEQELTLLAKEKKEAMKEAKRESKRLLEQANSAIENTIRKIKEAQAEKIQTKEVRKEFEQFKENFDSEEIDDTAFNKRIERLRKLKKGKEKTSGKEEKESIKIGSTVRVKGQDGYGQVIEIKKDNVVIALGQFKLPAKLDQLEIVSNNKIKKENRNKNSYIISSTIEDIRERNLNFKREIDVRGMRGDEALQAVTYFIDDAIIVNVEQVRILHGTGTGIL
jgi:DNA mismatch repair protein MutS2